VKSVVLVASAAVVSLMVFICAPTAASASSWLRRPCCMA